MRTWQWFPFRFPQAWTTALLTLLLATLLVAPAGPADAPRASAALVRPNIVLIVTDDQTTESVAHMPYLSSRTNWIRFQRAHVNNGLCCPSRATILRGQYDTRTRVGTNAEGRFFDERETLAVWLRRAGYATGMYGKYLNRYPFGRGLYVPAGWTDWHVPYDAAGSQWGMYDQYNYKINANGRSQTFLNAPADYQVNVLATRLTAFVRKQAAARRPFFAMFTPTATHGPWRASPRREGTTSQAPVPRPPNFNRVAPDQPAYLRRQAPLDGATMDSYRRLQFAAAASVDDAIRRIDDTLRATGVYQNTIMIFMTDNGYSHGSHRWERKRCEFNECTRTPLLVRHPGLAGRRDTTHLISNVDVAATVSQFAGARPAVRQDGRSFAPLVRGQSVQWRKSLLMHWPGGDMEGRPGRPDSMPQWWGVLGRASDGRLWKYVELDTGERELYNEQADPYEMNNLAGEPAHAAVQRELRAELTALKTSAGARTTALRADQPVPGPLGPDLG